MKRLLLFVGLLFAAVTANAATLYIAEFPGAPPKVVYYQAVSTPTTAEQTVAIGGSSARSAAFNQSTGIIRIQCDVSCNVEVGGTSPTATTSSGVRLAAGQTEYFIVKPGDKIAVIAGA